MKVVQQRTARTNAHDELPDEKSHEEFALKPAMEDNALEAALLMNDAIQQRIVSAHRGEVLVRKTHGRRDTTKP